MTDLRDVADKITRMCYAQHELNAITNGAAWMALSREWWRAIWVECAELMQQDGTWEWWKKKSTERDVAQIKMELVDIWHFGMSHAINRNSSVEEGVEYLMLAFAPQMRAEYPDFLSCVEVIAHTALDQRGFNSGAFFAAWEKLGGTFDELYALYNAKRVLNHFRQKHGYKQGQYEKMWEGKEDNVWLVKLVAYLPVMPATNDEYYEKQLTDLLELCYKAVLDGEPIRLP